MRREPSSVCDAHLAIGELRRAERERLQALLYLVALEAPRPVGVKRLEGGEERGGDFVNAERVEGCARLHLGVRVDDRRLVAVELSHAHRLNDVRTKGRKLTCNGRMQRGR